MVRQGQEVGDIDLVVAGQGRQRDVPGAEDPHRQPDQGRLKLRVLHPRCPLAQDPLGDRHADLPRCNDPGFAISGEPVGWESAACPSTIRQEPPRWQGSWSGGDRRVGPNAIAHLIHPPSATAAPCLTPGQPKLAQRGQPHPALGQVEPLRLQGPQQGGEDAPADPQGDRQTRFADPAITTGQGRGGGPRQKPGEPVGGLGQGQGVGAQARGDEAVGGEKGPPTTPEQSAVADQVDLGAEAPQGSGRGQATRVSCPWQRANSSNRAPRSRSQAPSRAALSAGWSPSRSA